MNEADETHILPHSDNHFEKDIEATEGELKGVVCTAVSFAAIVVAVVCTTFALLS